MTEMTIMTLIKMTQVMIIIISLFMHLYIRICIY